MLSSTLKEVCVHIRWMIRRDMPEVLDIENRSFEFAWTEEDFIRCLRQRNCIGMVAEHDERVVGFMIYELHKNRLHILNFAVHPDFRRRGVARGMVRKLIGKRVVDIPNRSLAFKFQYLPFRRHQRFLIRQGRNIRLRRGVIDIQQPTLHPTHHSLPQHRREAVFLVSLGNF